MGSEPAFRPPYRERPRSLGRALRRLARRARRKPTHEARWMQPADLAGLELAAGVSACHVRRLAATVPVVRFPPVVPAASLRLPPEELVLGVVRGSEARMYPTSSLAVDHVVNDRLGNEPLLVSFCMPCFSGMAFEPVLDGRTLTFGVFGAYRAASVLRDDQTGTLWAHVSGEGIAGPLAGRHLPRRPVVLTSAGLWLQEHPASTAPDPALMSSARSFRPGQFSIPPWWLATIPAADDRLAPRTVVVGVVTDGGARAYVLGSPPAGPTLVQDDLSGLPIALLGAPGAWPLAYDRRTDGVVVDLALDGGRITDETGTTWDRDGRAVAGPRAGSALAFVPSAAIEWYSWAAANPNAEIRDLRAQPGSGTG